ncbi:MAG: hypothetical protein WEB93_07895 [Sphingomonadales bacterium]
MKITPDSSLFSTLSRFPDPAQVRNRQPRQDAVDSQTQRQPHDPREAIRQEILRRQKAAQPDGTRAADGPHKAGTIDSGAFRPAETSAAYRREAPNADIRPKFIRMGQMVDIKV